jgi:cyclic-di-GMP phosphodiesterase TipF (flagellum assembly factor)
MSLARHLALIFIYCAASAATFMILPSAAPGLLGDPALMAAGLVLLAGLFFHEMLARRGATRALEEELSQLRRGWGEANHDLLRLRDEADRIRERLHSRGNGLEVGAVVAEVKLLQSLVERLYTARTGSPAPTPHTAPMAAPMAAPTAAPPLPPLAPATSAAPATAGAPAAERVGLAREAVRPGPTVRRDLDEGQLLEVLQDGLREDRVELWLQPVVSLPQRKRRHFECYTRIPVGDDAIVLPEQYIGLAERTGLITAIDNILLFRCIQLVRRLRRHNLSLGFFCNISPRTLADRDFFRDFVNMLAENSETASSIMFEFPQSVIENMDANLDRDLARLASLGFRFSLDQVTNFDFDPYALGQRNFRFVKVEAHRLLPSVAGSQPVPVEPLKRRFDLAGLDLVVEKIESEAMLIELLDLGIDFGQGYLFGEPRLSRPEL